MMDINKSPTLLKYKDNMKHFLNLYYPEVSPNTFDDAIDYSINKRMQNANAKISNSYKKTKVYVEDVNGGHMEYQNLVNEKTLQAISDYILSRQPIVTSFGTMFAHHGQIPNPLCTVVQSFLDMRSVHKKQMFQFPRGSEDFEKYNLLQSLDKIDGNG